MPKSAVQDSGWKDSLQKQELQCVDDGIGYSEMQTDRLTDRQTAVSLQNSPV